MDWSERFRLLRTVLAYPGPEYSSATERLNDAIAGEDPAVVESFAAFAAFVRGKSAAGLEEDFTNTFDVNPVCTLDIGWHLFGDDYNRGLFLAKVRKEMHAHGISETAELPDHLTHTLALLDRMEQSQAADFASACIIPAITKMETALREKNNPFAGLVKAAGASVRGRFCPPAAPASNAGARSVS